MNLKELEKTQTDYPKAMLTVLAALPTRTWQQLRSLMYLRYKRWDLNPPLILRRHINLLWADPHIWDDVCAAVKKIREADARRRKRALTSQELERRRLYKKQFMRVYMKEYRKGKRRRTKTCHQ